MHCAVMITGMHAFVLRCFRTRAHTLSYALSHSLVVFASFLCRMQSRFIGVHGQGAGLMKGRKLARTREE
jgi:hypothetical protein